MSERQHKMENAVTPETNASMYGKIADFDAITHKVGAFVPHNNQNIWNSRISWKIALSVFLTILVVQAAVLSFTVTNFENGKLHDIRQNGLSAIAPILQRYTGEMTEDNIVVNEEQARRLLSATPVQGLVVYSLDRRPLALYGETTLLFLNAKTRLNETYRSNDKGAYEVIYTSSELQRPYFIVARLDATEVTPAVKGFVKENILILLLLAAFVTCVLMLALSSLLLEPILTLKRNLMSAVKNPESPEVLPLKRSDNDEVVMTVQIANDLIEQNAENLQKLRQQSEDRIHKLAYYDTLTNLPNRSFFAESLDAAIKDHVLKKDKALLVISLDIDHFRDINDSMGHDIGDKLLEAVAERLTASAPEGAIISRASADEFAIVAFLEDDLSKSNEIIECIFAEMMVPVKIFQDDFQIRISAGLSHCPQDGLEVSQLMKNADIALNRAKEEGRGTHRFYSEDFDREVQERFQMLRELRVALENEQLYLNYHPQFDLSTGKMIGAEALLRWAIPDETAKFGKRFVSPADFIPVAESSGLIVPIGEWVMEQACQLAADWVEQGFEPIRIAVNISGVQFHRGDMVKTVKRILNETGLDPKLLELEVTESVFMDDIDYVINLLRELHALGCEIAIDDFGTGYSSLSYLRQFPIDRLKIDQSFIREVTTNSDDRAITRTIINLGHSLGLKVIAEGVETIDHQEFLMEENCDEVQGFKYTKPLLKEDLFKFGEGYKDDLEAI